MKSSKAKASQSADLLRRKLPRHKQMRSYKVKDPTLLKYNVAVEQFENFCRRRHMTLSSVSQADKHLAEYIADLFDEGEPFNTGSYALYGYILLRVDEGTPEKDLFPRARGALKGWTSRRPQASRTGSDPLVWYLMADTLVLWSVEAAAALLLQLDTYARPSEIVGLTRRDIISPVSRHCKYWGVIFGNSEVGELTKTGAQDDTVLLDSLDRSYAKDVITWVTKHCKSPAEPLFPHLDLSTYEKLFEKARKALKLQRFGLTPHEVRHSGPSADFLSRSRSGKEIQARGRWKSFKSVLRYQKPGQMQAKMNRLPADVWPKARLALPQVLRKIKQFYVGK